MAQSHSTSTTSWALAFPTYGSFVHIAFTNAFVRGLGDSVCLSVLSHPKWVACSLSSEAWVCYLKTFICRIPKFPRRRNSEVLLLGNRFCGWFTSSCCFLPLKRRRWYQWEPSHTHLFGVLLHPGSPEQRKTILWHFPLVQLPTTIPPTYPLPAASSSLTENYNINSSSSSSNITLGLIQTKLFSASSGLENGNAVSEGGGHNSRIETVYDADSEETTDWW